MISAPDFGIPFPRDLILQSPFRLLPHFADVDVLRLNICLLLHLFYDQFEYSISLFASLSISP
jgi:hypothetical protein